MCGCSGFDGNTEEKNPFLAAGVGMMVLMIIATIGIFYFISKA
jgi:hypothetical protein